MKADISICRKLALGSLLQGHFHNLKGLLQNIFIEFYPLLKSETLIPRELYQKIEKIYFLLNELNTYLSVATEDVKKEDEGPWNIKHLLEEEILFWKADLNFKHKVKVEILEEETCLVKIPWFLIKGMMCSLGQNLLLNLKDDTLKIVINSKEIIFHWKTHLEEEKILILKSILEFYQTFIDFLVQPTNLKLVFKDASL